MSGRPRGSRVALVSGAAVSSLLAAGTRGAVGSGQTIAARGTWGTLLTSCSVSSRWTGRAAGTDAARGARRTLHTLSSSEALVSLRAKRAIWSCRSWSSGLSSPALLSLRSLLPLQSTLSLISRPSSRTRCSN